jgi:hypothetical protein
VLDFVHGAMYSLANGFVVVKDGNLACVRFICRCNVVCTNALVLLPEGKMACSSISSWCNIFSLVVGNALVLVFSFTIKGKLA